MMIYIYMASSTDAMSPRRSHKRSTEKYKYIIILSCLAHANTHPYAETYSQSQSQAHSCSVVTFFKLTLSTYFISFR